ncbi:MAG: efflux RND transporter periplasmic adaptor subunit [Thermoguttaceae bacterium]
MLGRYCQHRSGFAWLGILGGLLLAVGAGCRPAPPAAEASQPAVPVSVAVPIQQKVADYEDFTGRLEAVGKVEIRSRVTGYLDKVCFVEGTEVKKGDLLFEIDARPFQAKYDQALAKIELCEADLRFRKAELARKSELVKKSAVSRSDYDQSVAAHDQAKAALAAAKAAAEEAKLNLGYTKLYSPVDGEVGRALIRNGNLVLADQTELTTVVPVDPVYGYFFVDERTILEVKEAIRTAKIKVKDNEEVPVQMGLMTEQGYPHQGYLDFMDNQLDPNTGTMRVRGVFANPKPAVGSRVLKAGYFARVRVMSSEMQDALMISERAIGVDQSQKYVLVVDDKNVVQYRPVTPWAGRFVDSLQVIESGLKPNDRVIVSGLQRVRPGMTVVPKVVDMRTFNEGDGDAKATPKK